MIKQARTRETRINDFTGWEVPVEKIDFGCKRVVAGVDQGNFYLVDPTQEIGGFPILEAFPVSKWELIDEDGRVVRHPSER